MVSRAKGERILRPKYKSQRTTPYTTKETRYREAAVTNAFNRAKKCGLPYSLDEAKIDWPNFCPVLGIPLDRRDRDHAPSIDRLIPEKGYTNDNCRVISMRANRIKNDASLEELEQIVAYLKNIFKKP